MATSSTSKSAHARKTASSAAKPAAPKPGAAKATASPTARRVSAAKPPVASAKKAAPATKAAPAGKAASTGKAAPAVRSDPRKPAARAGAAPTLEQRYRMTQEAAYYLAEKNGFAGDAADYWLRAEAQIQVLFAAK